MQLLNHNKSLFQINPFYFLIFFSKNRNEHYLEELPDLASNHRKQSQVPKLLNAIKKVISNGSGNNQLGAERPIGQIIRIIEKSAVVDFHCLWLLDGLGVLTSVIESGLQPNSDISRIAVIKAIQLYRNASSSCKQIAHHSILAGSFVTLLDVLIYTLKVTFSKLLFSIGRNSKIKFFLNVFRTPMWKLKRPRVQLKFRQKSF